MENNREKLLIIAKSVYRVLMGEIHHVEKMFGAKINWGGYINMDGEIFFEEEILKSIKEDESYARQAEMATKIMMIS